MKKSYVMVGIIVFLMARLGLAATINVNTTEDKIFDDANCSLREAVIAANTDKAYHGCIAGSGDDVIKLQPGTYTLGLGSAGEDNAMGGDLDIKSNITIAGSTTDAVIIDGGGIDRVFHVFYENVPLKVSFNYLIIKNGNLAAGVGGGIFVEGGTVNIIKSTIEGNKAKNGGGIYNAGQLIVNRSSFINNRALYQYGGAIYNSGTATINNSTMAKNVAVDGGACIYNFINSSATITSSTLSQNGFGGADGSLIHSCLHNNEVSSKISLINSILYGNGRECIGNIVYASYSNIIGKLEPSCNVELGGMFEMMVPEDFFKKSPGLDVLREIDKPGRKYFPLKDNAFAIDNGDTSVCVGDLKTDQMFIVRGKACDVGAIEAFCGDGVAQTVNGEECDDSNKVFNDGCSPLCKKDAVAEMPTDGSGTTEPGATGEAQAAGGSDVSEPGPTGTAQEPTPINVSEPGPTGTAQEPTPIVENAQTIASGNPNASSGATDSTTGGSSAGEPPVVSDAPVTEVPAAPASSGGGCSLIR